MSGYARRATQLGRGHGRWFQLRVDAFLTCLHLAGDSLFRRPYFGRAPPSRQTALLCSVVCLHGGFSRCTVRRVGRQSITRKVRRGHFDDPV